MIKIGRDSSCNILLEHDMISRHHAILRIYSTGKIELISMGANGTKLNGIMVRPNVVYKVKRSDMISFAGKFQLDWAKIPDPLKIYRILGICLLAAALLGGLVFAGYKVYDYFNPQVEPQFEAGTGGGATVAPIKKIEVVATEPQKQNNITLSIEGIITAQDSIKRLEELEKQRIEKSIEGIVRTWQDEKKKEEAKKNATKNSTKEKKQKVKEEIKQEPETKQEEKKQEKKAEQKKTDKENNIKNKIIN